MLAVSSNEVFNTAIKELKPEKRQKDGDKEKKEPNYNFNITTTAKKTQFLRKTETKE